MNTLARARQNPPQHHVGLGTACRPWIIAIAATAGFSVVGQPQQAWVARYDGGFTNQTHTPLAIALDRSGNVYVAGSSQNAGNLYDYVVLKYAPGGTQLFATRHTSTNGANFTVNGFALDQNGNSYETGTGGTLKFSANGALAWSAPYSGKDIAVDTNGNEYVTGFSTGAYATVKLDSNGSNLWLRTHVDITNDNTLTTSQKVAVDKLGNVYVAGYQAWVYFFNHGPNYYYQPAVLKYDGAGNPVWTNAPDGGEFSGTTKGLLMDNQGNVCLATDAEDADAEKINANGQAVWEQYAGSPPIAGMLLDANGNVYIAGGAYTVAKLASTNGQVVWGAGGAIPGGIDLDESGNVYVAGLSSNGTSTDFATIKYDNNGNQLWVIRYNGPANGNDGANALAVAPDGSIYVTGYSANASGGTDIVTIKYAPLLLQHRSDGTVLLQAQGVPGQPFDIEASADLTTWLDLGTYFADTNGLLQFDDTNAPLYPARFYYTTPQ